MRIAFVDIQGFRVQDQFFPKELGIEIGFKQQQFLFKAPIPYQSLNIGDKKTVRYLENHVHGIRYNSGYIEYCKLDEILKNHLLHVADYVYVRGEQKADFLRNKCQEFGIFNVIIVDVVKYDGTPYATPKFTNDLKPCLHHQTPGIFNCTQKNVEVLRQWFNNIILPL